MWQRNCSRTLQDCMAKTSKRDLVRAAAKARQRAVAPYSKFKVGAALLTRSGEIITGANVESASYGLTCCAERVALFNALTAGKRNFVAVAVVARAPGGPMPCGACRQLLAEYAPRRRGLGGGQPGVARDQGVLRAGSCCRLRSSKSRKIRIEKRGRSGKLPVGRFC